MRGRAGEHVEFESGAIHVDYGHEDEDTGVEMAARYHFNRRLAAALQFQDIGDFSTVMAGVRFTFGQ